MIPFIRITWQKGLTLSDKVIMDICTWKSLIELGEGYIEGPWLHRYSARKIRESIFNLMYMYGFTVTSPLTTSPLTTSPHCHFAPLPLRPIATSPHPNFPGARESCCRVQRLKITPRFFFKNSSLIVRHKKLCYGTKLAKINSLTKGCGPGGQGSGGFRFVFSKVKNWEK